MLIHIVLLALVANAAPSTDLNWSSFRGPHATGVADGQELPLQWDVSAGKNVRWQRELPGISHSSPITINGLVFVVTAVPQEEGELVLGDEGGISLSKDQSTEFSWQLFAIDNDSGQVLWSKEAYKGTPRAARHVKSSQANATPTADESRVVAIFGSQGMVAYDHEGTELWRTDLGKLDPGLFGDSKSEWGHASSPVLHGGKVFVQVDRHADSYIAAFDAGTGKEIWKVQRNEKPVWATPTIHQTEQRSQLIVLGGDFDRGLDPETGEELWRFARDLEVKTPTPFVVGDQIILSGGYRGKEIFSIAVSSSGTVLEDQALWVSEPGGPYTSTPVAYQGKIFFVRDTGIFTVLDGKDGSQLHRERTEGAFSASPVASDDKIYLAGEDGKIYVRSSKEPFEELAANDMGEPCMSTPAIANQTLFVRCGQKLWAIGGS